LIPNLFHTGTSYAVDGLRSALEENYNLFRENTIRQKYPGSAHKDTECIFIRGPREFTSDGYFESLDSLWNYKSLAPLASTINPIIDQFTKDLQVTELGRVLIVNLFGKSKLDEHIDEGYYADYYTRFHIPIVTNDRATLTVGDETIHLQSGDCWWFNHKKPHSGANGSHLSRIHLIIDAVSEKFKHPNDYEESN
jgi:hypothetical protein